MFLLWRIIKELIILRIIAKDKKIKSFRMSRLGSIEIHKKTSTKKEKKKEK